MTPHPYGLRKRGKYFHYRYIEESPELHREAQDTVAQRLGLA